MPLLGWAAIIYAVHDWWSLTTLLLLLGRQLYLDQRAPQPKKPLSKSKQKQKQKRLPR